MNLSAAMLVAKEEWRYWLRSKTGVAAGLFAMLLVLTSLITTSVHVNSEREARLQLQATAEETFVNQPARHPHRMVHYGHYVFRAPAPLAIADPGVDPYTGTVMFLEGHRQNSATFAPRYTQAHAGSYSFLSPALTYQLLVPLLLIVVGFASLARERETKTDQLVLTMAVSPTSFWFGKSIALAGLALLTLIPLAAVTLLAWLQGESGIIALTFWLGYAVYLLCWVFLVTAASAWSKRSTSALLLLLTCWIGLSLVLPRVASSTAATWAPLNSKLQNDLELAQELRKEGDGHNVNDPAFAKLRAQLLEQYDVEDIDELPINFRGVVADYSETKLTKLLNRFADRRNTQEMEQVKVANAFSLLSPYLALKSFSINTASTGLNQYQQFKQDAEAARFSFVTKINEVHTNELSYADDIRRNINEETSQASRVDARHWRVLDDFAQGPASTQDRLGAGFGYLVVLLVWMLGAALLGRMGVTRGAWKHNG